jgi:four helix bundle protein
MTNKEFANQLEIRTRKFAIMVLKLSSKISETPEGRAVRYQIAKSGTSVGANYREANRSRSKADFVNRIRISESENSETIYWLEIIKDMGWGDVSMMESTLNEANELLAIFSKIRHSSSK